MWRWLGSVVGAGALVAAGTVGVTQAGPGVAGAATGFGSNWTVYHQNGLGSGVDPAGTALSPARAAWTSPALDGQIYGEPLVENGRVFVATEDNTVYALAANTGGVLWATHIATAVPSGYLPCGDISPTVGITSTPVIDPARNEIFVVDDQLTGANGASHHLVGLDLSTGEIELNAGVDPPGSFPLYQLQRPGLALDAGQVIIGYGGNDGDCENGASVYHGWLVAVPEGGHSMRTFEVAANAGDSQGAVWMGGAAPLVDSGGNIWFATGNSAFGSASDSYDNSDGVIEVNSSLQREQYFAPSTWPSDNAADLDLGSSSPAILAGGLVFQAGKSRTAYVLAQSALGGVGHQLTERSSYCGSTVDGGSAVSGDTVYTPCLAGVVRTDVTPGNPPAITSTWQTSTGTGPPIIAGGLVWTIGGGTLYGLNPSTGVAEQAFALGSIANHFPTPSVADGLLLAPAGTNVKAFEGPGGLPPAPAPLGFVAHPGAANDVSVGGTGSAWVVGRTQRPGGNFNLYRWNVIGWTLIAGAVVRISIDPASDPWAINASHQIYHLGPAGWVHAPGTAIDISQGENGSLWVVGTSVRLGGFGIYHWNGAGWVEVPGGAVTIAVDPNGNPWAINNAHEIIHWVGGRFVRFPGSAEDIAVGAGGSVWVIGTNPTRGGYGIFRDIGTGWAEVPGGAVKIAVDAHGYPWVVNSAGQIFSY